MPLQRRYSVTGQTPPDNVGIKEPKLQALDTSVQQTSCGLCEGGVVAGGGDVVRKSSKRSATHLPSPSTPSSMELPTKIARLGLDTMNMDTEIEAALSDDTSDEDEDEDDTTFSVCSSTPSTLVSEPSLTQTPKYLTEIPIKVPVTLLTLPPEIRHQIYLNLPDIILPYPLIYCLSTFSNLKQHPLASVCQQIRTEALSIFYSYNTWVIKLEFKMMYDAFRDWIERLGEGAGCLRIVVIGIRGRLFRPQTVHSRDSAAMAGLAAQGFPMQDVLEYSPPDGDASFKIDLSEKFYGGRVETVRCDGTREAGEIARIRLQELVRGVWDKRCRGILAGEDWLNMVEQFMAFTGCEL